MTVFIDTSALYALLDRDDRNHAAAAAVFPGLLEETALCTTSYVTVEAAALAQRRLGNQAVRALLTELLAPVEHTYVDEELHRGGTTALLAASGRRVSLVDWISFEFMHRSGVGRAFAFDRDFDDQGFQTVP